MNCLAEGCWLSVRLLGRTTFCGTLEVAGGCWRHLVGRQQACSLRSNVPDVRLIVINQIWCYQSLLAVAFNLCTAVEPVACMRNLCL